MYDKIPQHYFISYILQEMIFIPLLTLILAQNMNCAKILSIQIIPLYSHQEVHLALNEELSLRGHQVVSINSFPLRNSSLTNLTEIDVSYLRKFNDLQKTLQRNVEFGKHIRGTYNYTTHLMNKVLQDDNFKRIYENSEEHFDLILVDCTSTMVYVFGYIFKAPVICVMSFNGAYQMFHSVGSINHPAFYTSSLVQYYSNSILQQKIMRIIYYLWHNYIYYYEVVPNQDSAAKIYFQRHLPYLGDLERNVSMLFINQNLILDEIRPTVPAIIDISLIHIKPVKPLPKVSVIR